MRCVPVSPANRGDQLSKEKKRKVSRPVSEAGDRSGALAAIANHLYGGVMIRAQLPPEFDAAVYRRENPDLASVGDDDAEAHYRAAGRDEGRIASPLARREGLVAAIDDGATLEIGPFCNPILRGPSIEYVDKLDATQLRARATKIGLDPAGCPERIHHLGGLEGVPGPYANIVASHSIEHHPDLVRHLEQVGRLLEPGGRYWLIVPDKRYCFDHHLPASTIADVLAAYQEARTAHSLKSVIEHVALVTHNDAERHWQGDHGEIAREETERRVAEALDAYGSGSGSYVDVHAWQFTPGSFRALMATLKVLGRTRLEVERVYDTPRGRLEFCAVLRRPLGRVAISPSGEEGRDIVMMQTADPYRYAAMLAATAPSVTEYCRRFGIRYESYTGVKRGRFSWQATFNRIVMFQELLDRGFDGWAIYLDADAYVYDLGFDLPAYLRGHDRCGAIFATAGVTGEHWDVNAGVAFVNLGHPQGRRLVRAWSDAFAGIGDERLRTGDIWFDDDNDQALLHEILKRDAAIAAALRVESMDFINSRHARFIRQHLRAQTSNLRKRVATITADVHAVLSAWGVSQTADGKLAQKEQAHLRNAVGLEPVLAEAPAAVPDPVRAAEAIRTLRERNGSEASTPPLASLASLLARGDAAAVAAELAMLGRSRAGQGILGGRRQHDRIAQNPAFARQRALQTYDALVSLAEATGALALERPHAADWGGNAAIPPELLFASLTRRFDADLSPPSAIGSHLGIAVDYDRILHLRMIEAIHAAWRVRQVLRAVGGSRVVELGGGAGLTAWYALALGVGEYAIVDEATLSAIQRYVLGDGSGVTLSGRLRDVGAADVLLSEDSFGDHDEAFVADALNAAREIGVGAVLSLNLDGDDDRRPLAEIAAERGWTRVARHHHALRPGFVDELFVPA